jgi:hypothetical protein
MLLAAVYACNCEVWLVDFQDGLVTRHCGHAVKFVLHAV